MAEPIKKAGGVEIKTPTAATAAQPAPAAAPEPVAPITPVVEAPVLESVAPAEKAVEVEVRDRSGEQWDKLLDSNKRLYEANELLRQEMQKRTASQQQFQPIQQAADNTPRPSDFIEKDPVTGEKYINESKLQAAIKQSDDRARKAEETVTSYIQNAEQREIERQNKETFVSYPELNPNDKSFDLKFHQQVRGLLYDSMVNSQDYGGRPLNFKDAADFIRGNKTDVVTSEVVEPTPAQKAGQAAKEQASQAAVPQPSAVQTEHISSEEEANRLRQNTRLGDDLALAQRLANTEHIVKQGE